MKLPEMLMSAILLMKHHTTSCQWHYKNANVRNFADETHNTTLFVAKMLMYAFLLMKHRTAEHFGNQSDMSVPQDGSGTVTKGNVRNFSDEGLHFL